MKARARTDLTALARTLDYRFEELAYLDEAMTHLSAASRARPANQRLEFLGDRVLGLIIAEALIARFPGEAEGKLAPRFNALVRKEACAEVAEALGLGEHLRMARSEAMTGGRRKAALLADAMEAVIAAIYLDGGMIAARDFVLTHWDRRFDAVETAPQDAKTALQEWAQARGLATPNYALTARDGPDHKPNFTVAAQLEDGRAAAGTAPSKRAAEQAAATALLTLLERDT